VGLFFFFFPHSLTSLRIARPWLITSILVLVC
jgi:hypothetical protein